MSKNLTFLDLSVNNRSIQIVCNYSKLEYETEAEEYRKVIGLITKGDIYSKAPWSMLSRVSDNGRLLRVPVSYGYWRTFPINDTNASTPFPMSTSVRQQSR